jgi:hypothetical protein
MLRIDKDKDRIKCPTSVIMGWFALDNPSFCLIELVEGRNGELIGPPKVQTLVLLWEPL